MGMCDWLRWNQALHQNRLLFSPNFAFGLCEMSTGMNKAKAGLLFPSLSLSVSNASRLGLMEPCSFTL